MTHGFNQHGKLADKLRYSSQAEMPHVCRRATAVVYSAGYSMAALCREKGISHSSLCRTLRAGTVRVKTLNSLLEPFGYELTVRKKD